MQTCSAHLLVLIPIIMIGISVVIIIIIVIIIVICISPNRGVSLYAEGLAINIQILLVA